MSVVKLNITDTLVVSGGRPYSFVDNYYNSVPYKIKLNINYFSPEGSIRTDTTFKITVTNNDKVNVINANLSNGNGSATINDDFTGSTKVDISLIVGQNENPINILPGTSLTYIPSSAPPNQDQKLSTTLTVNKGYGTIFKFLIIIIIILFFFIIIFIIKRKSNKSKMSFSKRISKH